MSYGRKTYTNPRRCMCNRHEKRTRLYVTLRIAWKVLRVTSIWIRFILQELNLESRTKCKQATKRWNTNGRYVEKNEQPKRRKERTPKATAATPFIIVQTLSPGYLVSRVHCAAVHLLFMFVALRVGWTRLVPCCLASALACLLGFVLLCCVIQIHCVTGLFCTCSVIMCIALHTWFCSAGRCIMTLIVIWNCELLFVAVFLVIDWYIMWDMRSASVEWISLCLGLCFFVDVFIGCVWLHVSWPVQSRVAYLLCFHAAEYRYIALQVWPVPVVLLFVMLCSRDFVVLHCWSLLWQ